ncbi:uncharacterized protein F4812DRAFT_459902 [Daldinia caldariorum]|uniref:uncharacterized protein n=1 Tax=Daldinia caldariorum TaxID=326644 RepID=UPI002007F30E|nr:uncharacterized protein F4812DRAFT_459902 [Daldinia caldariorum]KAI1467051.1 hypothetical protein F4812DRAFT_459902 [Daldinia caldariorum]
MVINSETPQLAWNDLPSDDVSASESHIHHGYEEGRDLEALFQGLPYPHDINQWILRQQKLKQEMYEQNWSSNMAADSGDETCMPEDLYSGCLQLIGTSTPYTGTQTTAVGVSGENTANTGRDFDPSHSQHNKGPVGNDPMGLPELRTTSTYLLRSSGANYNDVQAYMTGHHQTDNYLGYPDGLPQYDWYPNIPVLGEPLEGAQVSTSSFSSSVPSSATSEAMAAMTLNPRAVHSNAAGHLQADSSVASPGNPVSSWTSSSYPSTISPKMLRINPSPTPASSSESIHNAMLSGADLDPGASAYEHSHSHPRSPFQSQRQSQKPRKELPSKPARSRLVPITSSEPSPSSKGKRPALPQLPGDHEQSPQKVRVAQPKQERHDAAPQGSEGSPARGRSSRSSGVRSAKDEFLVRSKLAGMTYREIRRLGNFTEAESTLRGRFRTLTKDKEARVRKPEWQDNDIRLLKKAVRKLAKGNDMMPAKAPWGQVAEYIMDHGGSYQFGGATCHRKWKELVEEGKAGLK